MASKENTVLTGKLKRWNEAKGFGFIGTEEGQRDIFIHISDLKGMSRRPLVGDTIHYQVKIQNDGKNRAINARIDGVDVLPSHKPKKANNNQLFLGLALVAVIVIVALILI
ncbi:MAG: cold shock domain-containing protein [Thiomicrorhabdus sp.]|nr:cold shock domain-containing protein [Thiomicrorhabdus sp.]MCF6298880.1 cold shock domain-containing protein [Thiomicrorhabdus sp.]